jgi:hypothetical protein
VEDNYVIGGPSEYQKIVVERLHPLALERLRAEAEDAAGLGEHNSERYCVCSPEEMIALLDAYERLMSVSK